MTIEGLDKLIKKLRSLGEDGNQRISKTVEVSAQYIESQAKIYSPKNLGASGLEGTINAIPIDDHNWMVVVGAPYAAYMEFGTGAKVKVPDDFKLMASSFKGRKSGTFRDMVESLTVWVKQKQITGTYSIKTQRRSTAKNSRGETPEQEDKRIAFLIARSILKNGLTPRPFLYPAYKEGSRLFLKQLKQDIKDLTK